MKKNEIEGQLELDLQMGEIIEKKIDPPEKNEGKDICVLPETPIRPMTLEKVSDQTDEEEFQEDKSQSLKKGINPETLAIIENHLAAAGAIHIGTIMRVNKLDAISAAEYYDELRRRGKIDERGRSTEKRNWMKSDSTQESSFLKNSN